MTTGVPNKRKLNPEQVEQIAELRERGWSYGRIAMKFGVSDSAVYYRCLKMGALSPRSTGKNAASHLQPAITGKDGLTRRRFTPEEDEQLQRLALEGKKVGEIVAITGRARTSVRMRLMTLALHEEMPA